MYYTKRCIGSSVISMIAVQSSYFMNISFQFYHQHYRTSSTMLSCTICSFPGTNKYHVTFSIILCFLNTTTDCESCFGNRQFILIIIIPYSHKPLDISNQEFIFDTLTTSIKSVSVKRRLRTADCRRRTRGKMQTECKMQTAD